MVDMEAVHRESNQMSTAITLRQVAKLAGVSLTTASRVINGHTNVSDKVRERVWQVIRDNGYHPNQAARSLATRRTKKSSGRFSLCLFVKALPNDLIIMSLGESRRCN